MLAICSYLQQKSSIRRLCDKKKGNKKSGGKSMNVFYLCTSSFLYTFIGYKYMCVVLLRNEVNSQAHGCSWLLIQKKKKINEGEKRAFRCLCLPRKHCWILLNIHPLFMLLRCSYNVIYYLYRFFSPSLKRIICGKLEWNWCIILTFNEFFNFLNIF